MEQLLQYSLLFAYGFWSSYFRYYSRMDFVGKLFTKSIKNESSRCWKFENLTSQQFAHCDYNHLCYFINIAEDKKCESSKSTQAICSCGLSDTIWNKNNKINLKKNRNKE